MAFANIGADGTAQSSTANQTSASVTLLADANIGNLLVIIVAVDNNQTTDGDEGAVTSVTDSAGGNTWTKGLEFCNGQGSAQAGATCSLWSSVITNKITSGGTDVTVNFSNSTSRDKSVILANLFSIGAGSTVAIEATNSLANDGADPGSLNATTSNIECLRIRGIASETNSATALTTTTNWTLFTSGNQTSGGGSASNMAARGEFRISTGTSDASDPTFVAADTASVYVAFKEVVTASQVPWTPTPQLGPILAM